MTAQPTKFRADLVSDRRTDNLFWSAVQMKLQVEACVVGVTQAAITVTVVGDHDVIVYEKASQSEMLLYHAIV